MGDLQERITSTTKGSITSFQAVYVPADDSDRSGTGEHVCASGFDHRSLERSIAELETYPAVDPLASTSKALAQKLSASLRRRTRVSKVLQRYKDLQDVSRSWEWTSYRPTTS